MLVLKDGFDSRHSFMLVTDENFVQACEDLDRCPELFTDSETTGLMPWLGDRPVGVSMKGLGTSWYFPFMHKEGNLSKEQWHKFKPLLSKPDVTYVGFNYGFDLKMFHVVGVPLPKKIQDVMTAAHLLNENEESLAMKNLGKKYINKGAADEQDILSATLVQHGLGKDGMGQLPPALVAPYACQDVILTEQLRDFYLPHLKKWKIDGLWEEVNEYLLMIVEAEIRGMKLNVPRIAQYTQECLREADNAREVLRDLAGYDINPNSPKQLSAWLGIPSTADEILESLENKVHGVKEVRTYRSWTKVKGSYYDAFLKFMDQDGVLHPNLNLCGTITGRLSCSKPNLQAMPVRDAIYKAKDVIVARAGHTLVEGDYSQAELRIASHYAEEETMAEKLVRGADIHTETSDELDIPRDGAKRMNFSVIYGIGAETLAERLHVAKKVAQEYLNKYHAMYPGFKRLYRRCEATASDRGYIRMHTGRLRHYNTPTAYTHKASSNLIQGAVGEMVREALTKVHRRMPNAPMLMQIHDSGLWEIPNEVVHDFIPEAREIMEKQDWCSVPAKVDFKTGLDWGHMEKYKQ